MHRIFSKYIDKLFFKKWIIGIFKGSIEDIIRSKTFDPDINWLLIESSEKFYADPFLLITEEEGYKIIFEELNFDEDYGKILLMNLDKNFKQVHQKILLDTKSHLSYPFVFKEINKVYVFPEARKSGKLSCYEYDPANESLIYVKDILTFPLLDSTILKHDDKYWIFATISENNKDYKLNIFHSESLLGPYFPHPNNPVKIGLNDTRSAGSFIEVDGIIYRPSQNCEREYGESITIQKIVELSESNFVEEPYMKIQINRKKRNNRRIHKIHTINKMSDIVTVDGEYWTFSLILQLKKFIGSIIKFHKSRNYE